MDTFCGVRICILERKDFCIENSCKDVLFVINLRFQNAVQI